MPVRDAVTEQMRAILAGGPYHGKIMNVEPGHDTVHAAYLPRVKIAQPAPRPPWWHPLKRSRWNPAPVPELPAARTLIYQRQGAREDGTPVYWFRGEHDPTPPPSKSDDVIMRFHQALDAFDPAERLRPELHWLMGLDWYKAIRLHSVRATGREPGQQEMDEWEPQPGDQVVGLPIEVLGATGAPQLVTTLSATSSPAPSR